MVYCQLEFQNHELNKLIKNIRNIRLNEKKTILNDLPDVFVLIIVTALIVCSFFKSTCHHGNGSAGLSWIFEH